MLVCCVFVFLLFHSVFAFSVLYLLFFVSWFFLLLVCLFLVCVFFHVCLVCRCSCGSLVLLCWCFGVFLLHLPAARSGCPELEYPRIWNPIVFFLPVDLCCFHIMLGCSVFSFALFCCFAVCLLGCFVCSVFAVLLTVCLFVVCSCFCGFMLCLLVVCCVCFWCFCYTRLLAC